MAQYSATSMDEAEAYRVLKSNLSNQHWRLNNLYSIKDKSGNKIPFVMNWAQEDAYRNMWYFNINLKARQLGFTTFYMILFLDACLFNSYHSAGVIAHTFKDAKDLFENKAAFAYNNLPEWLKSEIKLVTDRDEKLVFSNGSQFSVGTSLRSGTVQKLLISEYGKVSAQFPEKAKEIKTGALNTVDSGQIIVIESTAEGKSGEFFDICETARKLADSGKELTPLEPKFHFYPWFKNPSYRIKDYHLIVIPSDLRKYLDELPIDEEQKAWYAVKKAIMKDEMKREYPSTPDEAFEGSTEGAYYRDEMLALRKNGRIKTVPYDPSYGVMTFWDLGLNDQMTVWFAQYKHGEIYFIDYHESSGQGWNYYANMLKEKGYTYLKHYWPHDGNKRIQANEVITSKQMAENVGISPIVVIPVTKSVSDDIRNYCKPTLPLCYFDHEKCSIGVNHLDNYRRVWDKSVSMFKNEPLHDESSHGADGFRTAARAFKTGMLNTHITAVISKSAGLKTLNRFEGKKVLKSRRY